MAAKVSVVMPVYNGERFLREAINSILSQTFPDFELIIVDDASVDGVWQILTEFAGQDSRIALIRNERNAGEAGARNRGLAAAQGEYIAIQDADDISLPERLAVQVNYLESHPQIGLVAAYAKRIDVEGNVLSIWRTPAQHEFIRAALLLNNPIVHSTVMVRRHLIEEIGGYPSVFVTDYELWWRLSRITQMSVISETLACYRSSGDSISASQSTKQLQGSQEISLRIAREIMGQRSFDEEAFIRFFLSSRGRANSLQPGDIRRLQPLWDFLAADPIYRQALRPKLLSCSLKLSRSQPLEALQLLIILRRQFKAGMYEIARKCLQTYTPLPLQRVGRYLVRDLPKALHKSAV